MAISLELIIPSGGYNYIDRVGNNLPFSLIRWGSGVTSLILFNAGNLYHRGVVRSKQRRVLQMNFTTGYGMWAKVEKINIPDYVDNRYIKKFYNKISL